MATAYPGLAAALGLFAGGAAGMILLRMPERILALDESPVSLDAVPGHWNSPRWWAAATYPFALGLAWLVLGVGSAFFYLRTLPNHLSVAILLWSLGMSCNLALARSAYELVFGVTGHHATPWSLGGKYRFRSRARIRLVGALRAAISVLTIVLSLAAALVLAGLVS